MILNVLSIFNTASKFYCPGNPVFLKIFDLSYAPALIFYAYIPIIIISIAFGILVFTKDRHSAQSTLLFLIAIFFSLWDLNVILEWIAVPVKFNLFFWQITMLLEMPISLLTVYFAYAFLNKKDINFKTKLILTALGLPVIIFLPTVVNIKYFDVLNCQGMVGYLTYYVYLLEIISVVWIVIFSIKKFLDATTKIDRKQILFFTIGIALFLTTFSLSNIFGELTQVYQINLFGPIGMVAFLGLMTYMIVRFKAFNIKLIATQALVWALIALIGAQFFFIKTPINFVLTGVTFVAVTIFGWLLIRSVKKEIQQREQIEKIEKELEKAYGVEKQAHEMEKQAKEQIEKAYKIEEKANEELKNLDKFKNQFLMQAQHDLRKPLTAISWYSDLLLGGNFGKLPKKATDVITRMQVVVQEKIKDVNNFLDIEQFKMGKGVVSLKPGVELPPILEEIINVLSFVAQAKGIYLKLEKPDEAFAVNADREKLKAAIFNIIDNAVKYTPKGGVDIKIAQEGRENLQIVIKDTGIGISQDKIKSLFETQFERSKQAEKTASGSGVGLYLSAQIIKLHNGKVWVESEGEGKGSTFYIQLPLSKDAQPAG